MHERSVLLVNSPLFRNAEKAIGEDYLPPLGLGILAAAALQESVKVDFIDAIAEGIGVDELVATIERSSCETVALNIFTVNKHLVRDVVEKVRRPVRFILGGLATRSLVHYIAEFKHVDDIFVVCGDGEKIFPHLLLAPDEITPTRHQGRARYFEVGNRSPYFSTDISGRHYPGLRYAAS